MRYAIALSLLLTLSVVGCDATGSSEEETELKEHAFLEHDRFPRTYGLYGSLDFADYDNDGDPDVLVVGKSNQGAFGSVIVARIFRNDRGGYEEVEANLARGADAGKWGDYDNDGDADIIITGKHNANPGFIKLYENANGSFVEAGVSFPEIEGADVEWGDFNNDGFLDVAVTGFEETDEDSCPTYRSGYATKVFVNEGGEDFREAVTIEMGGDYLDWKDFDGDGDLDILVGGSTVLDCEFTTATKVFRNDGGEYTDVDASITAVSQGVALWGDYDDNGDQDLFVGGYTGSGTVATIYRNEGGNYSEVLQLGSVVGSSVSAAWGDYDDDGFLDLVVSGRKEGEYGGYDKFTKVFRYDGRGFREMGFSLEGVSGGGLGWVDYDGDGMQDLFISGLSERSTGFTWIYRQEME